MCVFFVFPKSNAGIWVSDTGTGTLDGDLFYANRRERFERFDRFERFERFERLERAEPRCLRLRLPSSTSGSTGGSRGTSTLTKLTHDPGSAVFTDVTNFST
jgi:hypothetical protein